MPGRPQATGEAQHAAPATLLRSGETPEEAGDNYAD